MKQGIAVDPRGAGNPEQVLVQQADEGFELGRQSFLVEAEGYEAVLQLVVSRLQVDQGLLLVHEQDG